MASGIPSSRRHRRLATAALDASTRKPGSTARALSVSRATASTWPTAPDAVSSGVGNARGSTSIRCSPTTRSGSRLVARTRSRGAASSRFVDQLGTCVEQVLAVVEHQEQLPRRQVLSHRFVGRLALGVDAEGGGDLGRQRR